MKTRVDQEVSPFQSKKFIAFLVSHLGLSVVEGLLIFSFWGSMPIHVAALLISLVVVQGFSTAIYLGGQAALDKYVRLAKIVTGSGQGVSMKGITIAPKEEQKTPTEAKLDSQE